MYASTHDLLLVDGGAVGLCAAISRCRTSPKLSTAVVSRGLSKLTFTVSAKANGRHLQI
jgi:hypothetical protein